MQARLLLIAGTALITLGLFAAWDTPQLDGPDRCDGSIAAAFESDPDVNPPECGHTARKQLALAAGLGLAGAAALVGRRRVVRRTEVPGDFGAVLGIVGGTFTMVVAVIFVISDHVHV